MGEHPDVFPKLYVNMIRAGETGGILDSTLRYLVDYLENSLALKEEVKSALIYPIILTLVAGVSLIVLFVYVIPRFASMFKDVGQALPWITRVVLNSSEFLREYGWVLLILLIIGAAGVPLLQALGTVQGVVGNRLLANAISQVQVRVREGKGMARPLGESGLFPPLALNMIAVGEETGRLESMLANVAEHYDQEVKRTTKRLTSILGPALILIMALVIGVVVISMLLAIFSINDLPF
jgi:general secretion pathway protein F